MASETVKYYATVNELWAPGYRPDARAAAVDLIGEEHVAVLEEAGLRLQSIYWDVTREAVEAATGRPAARDKKDPDHG